jgi:hypothetical protein
MCETRGVYLRYVEITDVNMRLDLYYEILTIVWLWLELVNTRDDPTKSKFCPLVCVFFFAFKVK